MIHSFDPCLSCAVHVMRPAEGAKIFRLGHYRALAIAAIARDRRPHTRPPSRGGRRRPRILVAGLGNLLLKDDGVGVHAVRALQHGVPRGVRAVEVGTAVLDALHLVEVGGSGPGHRRHAGRGRSWHHLPIRRRGRRRPDDRGLPPRGRPRGRSPVSDERPPARVTVLGVEPETIAAGLRALPERPGRVASARCGTSKRSWRAGASDGSRAGFGSPAARDGRWASRSVCVRCFSSVPPFFRCLPDLTKAASMCHPIAASSETTRRTDGLANAAGPGRGRMAEVWMLIVMVHKATQEQVGAVLDAVRRLGYTPSPSRARIGSPSACSAIRAMWTRAVPRPARHPGADPCHQALQAGEPRLSPGRLGGPTWAGRGGLGAGRRS